MIASDPLADLVLPAVDPDELEADASRMTGWLTALSSSAGRQHAAVASVSDSQWSGMGAVSARSGAEKVVSAYTRAAGDLGDAVRVIHQCADEWRDARDYFEVARRMADEALIEESVCLAGAVLPDSELRHRARDLALRAIADVDSAAKRAAAALADLSRQVEHTPGFLTEPHRPWYRTPLRWASDALHPVERSGDDFWNAGRYIVDNPTLFGKLFTDSLQIGGGAALTMAGAAGFGGGLLLDATGVGAAAGVPLDAVSALGLVVGTGLVGHGVINAISGWAISINGGPWQEIPQNPEPGWLRGQQNVAIRRPLSLGGGPITDIDEIDEELTELKTATWAPNARAWIQTHIDEKFQRYLFCRTVLPTYDQSPITFTFLKNNVDPPFRAAVESAVDALRTAHPDVKIGVAPVRRTG